MAAELNRRGLLAMAALFAVAPQARAQTESEATLSSLLTFFNDAAVLTGAMAASVTRLKPAKFAPARRADVGASLSQFNETLGELSLRQSALTGNIADYVASVRANGFQESVHPALWRALTVDMRAVADRVDLVYSMQERADWIKVALTAEQEMTLRDTLRSKRSILDSLRDLPAPRTPIEIDKLDAVDGRYLELVKRQYELRVALAKAARRFSPQKPT